jgi:hypothetical protein
VEFKEQSCQTETTPSRDNKAPEEHDHAHNSAAKVDEATPCHSEAGHFTNTDTTFTRKHWDSIQDDFDDLDTFAFRTFSADMDNTGNIADNLQVSPIPEPAIEELPIPGPAVEESPISEPAVENSPIPGPAIVESPIPEPAVEEPLIPGIAIEESSIPEPAADNTKDNTGYTLEPAVVESPIPGPAMNCSGHHGLKRFITENVGYKCDVCHTTVDKSAEMWGCRECNFDVCLGCPNAFTAEIDDTVEEHTEPEANTVLHENPELADILQTQLPHLTAQDITQLINDTFDDTSDTSASGYGDRDTDGIQNFGHSFA